MRLLLAFLAFLALCLAPARDPYDLQAALDAAQPGDTLTIPPGVYRGNYTSNGSGYTVEAHGVTISGLLTINGADQTWRGLEVAGAWTTRAMTTTAEPSGLTINGPRTLVQDCRIHDTRDGLFSWEPANDSVIDGCAFWNNGYKLNGAASGHSLYIQNVNGGKTVKNSYFGPTYYYGIHAYGQLGRLNGLRFAHNAVVSGWLVGGGQPVRGLVVRDNMTHGASVDFGYGNMSNADAWIVGNHFNALTYISGFQTLTVTQNLWMDGYAARVQKPTGAAWEWDANVYACGGPQGTACLSQFRLNGTNMAFSGWQAQGYDRTSAIGYVTPGLDYVDIGPGPGLGMVVIANKRNRPSVQVDTGSLPAGAHQLVNACNPAEWLAFTAGPPLAVPMTSGWTCAAPIGASAPLLAFDPKFGVFYVE